MSRPSRLYRVEWYAARLHLTPLDRVFVSRQYPSPYAAGAQVLAIRRWEKTHTELLGVWVTTGGSGGLDWQELDPDELPASEDAMERDAMFRAAHTDEFLRESFMLAQGRWDRLTDESYDQEDYP